MSRIKLLLYLRISHVQFQRSIDVKFKMADCWHFFAHASKTLEVLVSVLNERFCEININCLYTTFFSMLLLMTKCGNITSKIASWWRETDALEFVF